eukprot:CAMPEP_0197736294 /NCGR_PEP_ID=MMETSP1435-20131217/1590_1 /TAXON_ID=426625 /ORGANISM="Chaetoceros brevis, Strain CCMP164" /LENGTH=134 /DNA_ID=CAMNT_0043324389 /DNA_START=85 /DNA_END=489 /DNA_ORIENTATION=-
MSAKEEKTSAIVATKESEVTSSFALPKIELKSTIKTAVSKTNEVLSIMEVQKDMTSSMVGSRIRPLAFQAKQVAQKAVIIYESRQHYAPQIIAGSAATIGLLVSVRRGKVPGALMGTVGGVGAYAAVYGQPPKF